MAQVATHPKIDELRSRLKADPKSRLFYQLAEELRKAGQPAEAEQVLRTGLENHDSYLAAWVSLGRVMREQKDDAGAIDPLNKALQLDPGNVVAARLLGDAYLGLGEKLEAIKKYKLVHALLPSDETLQETIERLEGELAGPAPADASTGPAAETAAYAAPPEETPATEGPREAADPEATLPPSEGAQPMSEAALPMTDSSPLQEAFEPSAEPLTAPVSGEQAAEPFAAESAAVEDSPFDRTVPPFAEDSGPSSLSSAEPFGAEESPFAPESQADPFAAAREPEPDAAPQPLAFFESPEPAAAPAEAETSYFYETPEGRASAPAREEVAEEPMRQEAPEVGPAGSGRVEKLEKWLSRVRRREDPHV